MVSRAVGVAALTSCVSSIRIAQLNDNKLFAGHSPYTRHVNKNCFIDQGGDPVDPEGDPPLQSSTSADECMMACDNTPQCVGVTHHNWNGACYLRRALDIARCQSNTDYSTYTHPEDWVNPGDASHDERCGDLTQQPNLLCARHVDWAFASGKHAPWATAAYADMQVISGVGVQAATRDDFQRLSYCVNFRNEAGEITDQGGDPCEMPPCTCSTPPCHVCALERGHPDHAEVVDVELVPPGCPQPPDNGGCPDAGTHNRFCPSTRGCFSSAEEHLCPGLCPAPQDAQQPVAPHGQSSGLHGWNPSQDVHGHWGWCRANRPAPGWNLNGGAECNRGPAVNIRALTYNLFWWNLFGIRGGMWQSAGRLIQHEGPFDLIGFQECDDVDRVLADTSMGHEYGRFEGVHSVSTAWHLNEWELLAQGSEDVAEDHRSQWYGRRALVWVRVRHYATGAIVFFANHHGPLPVGNQDAPGGGFCGPEATAFNILKTIGNNAHKGDAIILAGDFNALRNSRTSAALSQYLTHQFEGNSFDGVDNFYSNDCARKVGDHNHGNGGSDHDALSVTFTVHR